MKTPLQLEPLVDFTLTLCRLLWGAVLRPDSNMRIREDGYTSITHEAWTRHLKTNRVARIMSSPLVEHFKKSSIILEDTENRFVFWSRALSAPQLMAALQGAEWPEERPILRYCLWRSVRRTYGLGRSKETVNWFHRLTTLLNEQTRGNVAHLYVTEFNQIIDASGAEKRITEAFVESCLHLQVFKPSGYRSKDSRPGARVMVEPNIDAEFLLSNIFGLPTSIPGFDELFGGGGMILGECASATGTKVVKTAGRVIFINGGFGAGKTTLALSLAAEVARKGGLSFFLPLEQSAEDCEMCLATLNLGRDPESAITLLNTKEQVEKYVAGTDPHPKAGGVIALATLEKDETTTVMTDLARIVHNTHDAADLRLFVIDSFNSILDFSKKSLRLRAAMVKQIRDIVASGANLLICGETEMLGDSNTNFIQNIADVVISLSSDISIEGYYQRYMRVEKSRLQREMRGAHAYSIKPGVGFDIYPSSAATASRMRNRRLSAGRGATPFGWQELDRILGPGAIQPGDVIAIEGDSGCLKTQLGLQFAMAMDVPRPPGRSSDAPRSLILALGDRKHTITGMAIEKKRWLADKPKNKDSLIVKEGLSVGFIQPGKVFQLIDEAFDSCVGRQYIDRVWIDNLWRWDWLCPFIKRDHTFGQTLVDYFRKQKVTSLFTCRNIDADAGGLQRAILDLANIRIKVQRIEHRGNMVLVVRIIKSRGMRHKTENFILEFDGDSMRISDAGNMLRINSSGVHAIPTRLFLHSETTTQENYNESLAKTMKPLMGGQISVLSENRTLSVSTEKLSDLATVDELQIWQLDEFQVPTKRQTSMSTSFGPSRDNQFYAEMASRIGDDKGMWAVPYFRNVGVLAVVLQDPARPEFPPDITRSWKDMAALASQRDLNDRPLFDFAKPSTESFVCLWIEMMLDTLCHTRGENALSTAVAVMRGETEDDRELVTNVCHMFRTLCRPAYAHRLKDPGQSQAPLISRQWFTTLGTFLQEHKNAEGFRTYTIMPLPSNLSVSGDWYLGISNYTAAPACASRILDFMTSVSQQSHRLSSGIGLPVRPDLLDGSGLAVTGETIIDPKIFRTTFGRGFRRSSIPHYRSICQQWALCIKHLLDVSDSNLGAIAGLARSIEHWNQVAQKIASEDSDKHTSPLLLGQ